MPNQRQPGTKLAGAYKTPKQTPYYTALATGGNAALNLKFVGANAVQFNLKRSIQLLTDLR